MVLQYLLAFHSFPEFCFLSGKQEENTTLEIVKIEFSNETEMPLWNWKKEFLCVVINY